jgi:hypothetical protein
LFLLNPEYMIQPYCLPMLVYLRGEQALQRFHKPI